VTEAHNELAPGANLGALIIGLIVAAIGASMGYLEAWRSIPLATSAPDCSAFSPVGVNRRYRHSTTIGLFQSSDHLSAVRSEVQLISFSFTNFYLRD
jgi:hypothetical protein